MKTEQEIREEIKNLDKEMDNYRDAYDEGNIPFSTLKNVVMQDSAMISVLMWVLGENERYD